ncbi:MAG TPA: ABC transporter permease [Terriglobia bacterium]|nr:ABC transporter permease [Terriglobia bacterium]
MQTLLQDVRYGLRMLASNRGFTIVAVLTLTLGIGANTAIFSVIDGVLLRPLPYRDPGRLVIMGEKTPEFDMMSVSYPNFLDWQRESRSFEGLGAHRWTAYDLTGSGTPEHLDGKMVSAGFFPTLGITPLLGRDFDAREDHLGAGRVAMISGGLWKRRFAASSAVIGKPITLSGQSYTVIGVVPGDFRFLGTADVYTLLDQWDDVLARSREAHPGMRVVGRLKPGVTQAQAQAEMSGIAAQLAQTYPKSNARHGVSVRPLEQEIVGDARPSLLVLLGAVGFVLLIACANVANLLLARSTTRRREMAIRAAIGASQGRMVRQLLTESVLLALAGGALGLLLARWGTQAVVAAIPGGLPRMENIGVDGWVLAFTLAVSVAAGVIFGLAPALQISRLDLHATLQEGTRGSTGSRQKLRSALVVAEVAASLVLLIGAALMLKTMWQLSRVNPGFKPQNLLTFSVGLSPANRATSDGIRTAYGQLAERIRALPGVEAAGVVDDLPLSGSDDELPFWVSGRPRPNSQSEMSWALNYDVSPDYLRAMGIPLLRGRFISETDTVRSAPVTVIDEVMAKRLFPGQDPVGQSIRIAVPEGFGPGLGGPITIVGVVGHVKHFGLDTDAASKIQYQLYLPFVQLPDQIMPLVAGGMTMMVRTSVDPLSMAGAIRRLVASDGGDQPVFGVQTMERIVSDSVAGRRFSMLLLGVFAGLALVLAAVGIYGVISYTVTQRTHEIGIRMALGAERTNVLTLVVGNGLRLLVVGVGIGLAAAVGLTRLMSSMLYGVRPTDMAIFAAVSLLLAAVAVLASYIPARRATKVDPMVALRYE